MAKLKTVTFRWSTEHGECYDCGRPAAFYNWDLVSRGFCDTAILCAVCAANVAADGGTIGRIEDDVIGLWPETNA